MIPNKPKITDEEVDKIAKNFFPEGMPELVVFGIRGYFLNTFGNDGENDVNVYDDAILVYEDGTLISTFNANTDPSKLKTGLAMLDPGVYQFAKGKHKNRIDAFRAYPEGIKLPCTRNGKKSWCSYINIHDGGLTDTWSAGCQTLPNTGGQTQFADFRNLVYNKMTKHHLITFTYVLLEEATMRDILNEE